jgi:hypothetical protein
MAQAVLVPAPRAQSGLRIHYAATIFVGAFLLFQIQPLMGKFVLPWFGGIASVWTTCMLFFQLLLLGGYLYSHLLSTKLKPKARAVVHAVSLAVAAGVIIGETLLWRTPLLPSVVWRPASSEHPLLHLLALLMVAVGLPYLLLSSTGPLLQNWFARTHDGKSPYGLYALSNAGSLLGLITYPLVFEPVFGLHVQAWIWCAGYAIFILGSAFCAWAISRTGAEIASVLPQRAATTAKPQAAPLPVTQLLWFLLAALPSLMLLATTNLICQEIAVIPFLWVLPLSLYLITLIVCFDRPGFYRRGIFHTLLGIVLPFATLALLMTNLVKPVLYLVSIFCVVLFFCCMVCHGELVRLRPQPAYLTRFYLLISAGGAAGGLFVAVVAPNIFSGYWEFHAGLAGCVLLVTVVLALDKNSWWYWPFPGLGWLICLGIGMMPDLFVRYFGLKRLPEDFYTFHYYGLFTVLAVVVCLMFLRERKRPVRFRKINLTQFATIAVLVGLAGALWLVIRLQRTTDIRRDRNFYGSLAIIYQAEENGRLLVHGQTSHGLQLLDHPRQPTLYFTPGGGLGLFMGSRPSCFGPCRTRYGIIGMGAGTIAAYGRSGEVIRYYEINPQVIEYSSGLNPYFTFIRDSAAKTDTVQGDARLSLERELKQEGPEGYDVLIVDAFNSDSIPVHLLTQEAASVYLAHLRSPDSVLAFHISNRTLDLRPVLLGLALKYHLSYVRVFKERSDTFEETSDWVFMSRNPDVLALPAFAGHVASMPPPSAAILWTDDYSNLFRMLKLGGNSQ